MLVSLENIVQFAPKKVNIDEYSFIIITVQLRFTLNYDLSFMINSCVESMKMVDERF